MNLKDYLNKKGIKVSEFGHSLNLSRTHMYALVRGSKKPSLELAVLIEDLTEKEVTPRDFCK
jgi:DNA-binding XRE family transcriptional regulator